MFACQSECVLFGVKSSWSYLRERFSIPFFPFKNQSLSIIRPTTRIPASGTSEDAIGGDNNLVHPLFMDSLIRTCHLFCY